MTSSSSPYNQRKCKKTISDHLLNINLFYDLRAVPYRYILSRSRWHIQRALMIRIAIANTKRKASRQWFPTTTTYFSYTRHVLQHPIHSISRINPLLKHNTQIIIIARQVFIHKHIYLTTHGANFLAFSVTATRDFLQSLVVRWTARSNVFTHSHDSFVAREIFRA